MATKYILDQIKVEGVLCDLIGKSNGENVSVTYGGTEMTLAAALAKILTDVSALPTDADVTAAVTALKQEMLGDTPVEAYNTFTELADYIENHQDAADALTAAIGTKANQSDLTALQNTVNALGALAAKSTVSESDLDSALKEKVNAASEGNHSHNNKALLDTYDQTNANIKDYSKIIHEVSGGGADIASTSPGWTGHMAFVDPIPEFIGSGDIEEWLNQPAQLVTLHPMTIMQNSLNGTFGQSGDIANVPPKAATIGPLDVMRAKERIEVHALATCGTFSSWQRMTSRLVTHGPITPYIPSTMLQTKKTQVYISEELAAPFECWEKVGY